MNRTSRVISLVSSSVCGRTHVHAECRYTSSALKRDFDRIIDRATSADAAPTLLFTIFLGANDACIIGDSEYVPWPRFEANIRAFIDTILSHDAMAATKIVLITPPPVALPPYELKNSLSKEEIGVANDLTKLGAAYRTFDNKRKYAVGIMRTADEYEKTGRVVGLNFWRGLVDALLEEEEETYDEEMPPGCGLLGATGFCKGWFTDGLHLDVKGYNVLSKALFELVTEKWPELAPERL